MTMILTPVIWNGDRGGFDPDLSPIIVTWLRMMMTRLESQLASLRARWGEESCGDDGDGTGGLPAKIRWLAELITSVEDTWSYDRWHEAEEWVRMVLEGGSDNPTSSSPPSTDVGDGIGPQSGT